MGTYTDAARGGALDSSEIDQVIDRLGEILDWSWESESRIGYFAAMYRRVTKAVKEAIEAGEFKDPERMTRLDVVFANRYIEAVEQHREGRRPTEAWAVSFQASTRPRLLIVQQLLTGINAHINLDLGIAAATVAPGDELMTLRDDFDTINEVLGRLVEAFVGEVEQVSPWIRFLGRIGGRSERIVIKFSIDRARDEAWDVARRLASEPQPEWPRIIDDRDGVVAKFGRFLQRPGTFLPIGLLIIRLRETNDVRRVIDGLSE